MRSKAMRAPDTPKQLVVNLIAPELCGQTIGYDVSPVFCGQKYGHKGKHDTIKQARARQARSPEYKKLKEHLDARLGGPQHGSTKR